MKMKANTIVKRLNDKTQHLNPSSRQAKRQVIQIKIADIKVRKGRRALNMENVRSLAESMKRIGLKTPITVRLFKGGYVLVAGKHRVEAAKYLGWKIIDAFVQSGSKRSARLWEASENLHRAELTVLERAERIEAWRKHFEMTARVAQVAPPGGRQPKNVGIRQTAKSLGFSKDDIQRSALMASIAPKVKAMACKKGLDNIQSKLLAIAKQKTPKAQLKKLTSIVKSKRVPKHTTSPATEAKATAAEIAMLNAKLHTKNTKIKKLKKKVKRLVKRVQELENNLPKLQAR